MRLISRLSGAAALQAVQAAADMDASSVEETDFEAWVARRKAKKKGEKKKRGEKEDSQ